MAAPFDPAAATADWLSHIPAAQRLAAQNAMDWRMTVWVMGGLVMIGIAALIARNDSLGAIRRRLEANGPQPWLSAVALSGGLTLILLAVSAVIDGLAYWRADMVLFAGGGVPKPPGFDVLVAAAASGLPLGVLIAMALVPLWLGLMRWRPRTWPLFAGGFMTAIILGLSWLPSALGASPALQPAAASPARDAVLALIAQTHLPASGVLAWPAAGLDGDVIGGFGPAKVLMGSDLLAAPPDQASAYVGHLMGHYVHGDTLIVCLIASLVITAGFFAMQRWTLPLAKLMCRRPPPDAADPEALPALAVIGMLTLTVASLAAGAYLRFANYGADAYSLDNARAPDGLVAILERTWDHAAVDPNPLEAAVLYTHPPLASRIAHALAWKAAHGG